MLKEEKINLINSNKANSEIKQKEERYIQVQLKLYERLHKSGISKYN